MQKLMFFMIPDVLINATEFIEDTNLLYCKVLPKILYEHQHHHTFFFSNITLKKVKLTNHKRKCCKLTNKM